jgi:Alcohol dehydrogenase transcription factor Myb/SANT-like
MKYLIKMTIPGSIRANEAYEESLIKLVSKYEDVYNHRMAERSKVKFREAWAEIREALLTEFPTLQLSVEGLQKKWSNIKDTWLKCHKKMLIAPVKPYIYYYSMEFMQPVYEHLNRLTQSRSCPDKEVDDSGTGKRTLGKKYSKGWVVLLSKFHLNSYIFSHFSDPTGTQQQLAIS